MDRRKLASILTGSAWAIAGFALLLFVEGIIGILLVAYLFVAKWLKDNQDVISFIFAVSIVPIIIIISTIYKYFEKRKTTSLKS